MTLRYCLFLPFDGAFSFAGDLLLTLWRRRIVANALIQGIAGQEHNDQLLKCSFRYIPAFDTPSLAYHIAHMACGYAIGRLVKSCTGLNVNLCNLATSNVQHRGHSGHYRKQNRTALDSMPEFIGGCLQPLKGSRNKGGN